MNDEELRKIALAASCRTFGLEDASNDAHRIVLAKVIQAFPSQEATILCEPSLARSTKRPPDIVLVEPIAGVHVVEVKGHLISQIESLEAGGQIRFHYGNRSVLRNPIAQVRSAMFDIKNSVERCCEGELVIPFKYWVMFPNIVRRDWYFRFGGDAYCPTEFLFADDLESFGARILRAGQTQLANASLKRWPSSQLAAIGKAFGDTTVLYNQSDERELRKAVEGSLGELFDEAAETYKTLSEEQQRLSEQNWQEGPRLIRGVAGSGKTIVLANNLARRLHRSLQDRSLLDNSPSRMLVVCNNRSLVPFLAKKLSLAFEQRTGRKLPEQVLEIFSHNRLLFHLSQKGLWRYQRIEEHTDQERAFLYLKELEDLKANHADAFDANAYDAIYVDEGQDFLEEDFRLLKSLCRVKPGREPNLYVFYDDAQNFLGRKRPNWLSLGLSMRGGRAHVMSQCFRNTRQIVEAAFNVLYGACAVGEGNIPTKEFGDIATLQEKGLIDREHDGFWRVGFAMRSGETAKLTLANSRGCETQEIVSRIRWLVEVQQVRPQDILVLAFRRKRVVEIAEELARSTIVGIEGLHVAIVEQDKLLGRRSLLTLSTTASAKGYDAYVVLLASANEFDDDVMGRISFYVGCTRAIEYLEVFGYQRSGLVREFDEVLKKQSGLKASN